MATRAKRTNYVRANDGKFSHTPGSGGSKAKTASTSKAKTASHSKGKPVAKSNPLSAAKSIAKDASKLSAHGGGTAGGTITAKDFKKNYKVSVKKLPGGGTERTVTRHTTKVVNGKKVNVDVTRDTVTKDGVTTVKRTVGTGAGAKTTTTTKGKPKTAKASTHKPAAHKSASNRKAKR
jgi:hypothetical protein